MARRYEWVCAGIVIAGLGILAAAVAPRFFVLFDEAYNINVSQNLAGHGMYATRLGDWYQPFDPDVTTGPALLVPLAAAIRLGGASLSVVRAAMLWVFVLSLLLAFFGARELLGGTLPALTFLILFASTSLVLEFGLSVLGDVPAVALTVAGFGLMRRAERSPHRLRLLALSGCTFGLSVLAKDIMLLVLPAIALAWAARFLMPARAHWRGLVPAAIAAAFSIGWRVYQLAALQSFEADAFAIWQRTSTEAAQRMWTTVAFAPISHVVAAWRDSVDYFLPLLLSLLIAVAGYVFLRRLPGALGDNTTSFAQSALAVTCGVWLVWFYALSGPQANQRHLLPGVVLGEVLAIGIGLRLLAFQGENRAARVSGALLALSLLWSILYGAGFLRLYLASSEPRLDSQQQSAAWIRANTPGESVLSGWGWFAPWHVGFLAQRTVARVDPSTPGLVGLTEWFVLSPEVEWSGGMDDRLRDFLARQEAPVIDQRLYPVYHITWRP